MHSRVLPVVSGLLVSSIALVCSFSLPTRAGGETPNTDAERLVVRRPASGRFVKTPSGYMVPYQAAIPGTNVRFQMQPVPGQPAQRDDQGRIVKPALEPFWIAAHEVTWGEYVHYMALYQGIKEAQNAKFADLEPRLSDLDAVTAPTEIFEPHCRFEFLPGPRTPATSMTQFAARQYTRWLSAVSKQVYFLPTQRQWRHACLAGADAKWSVGNDAERLKDIAVYRASTEDESTSGGPSEVGTKKPNAWGLFDMHGNVAEWVIRDDALAARPPKLDVGPERGKDYAWIACGGSWDHPAEQCQASSILKSDEAWWDEDANLPLSPWWLANHTRIHQVGFRIISPLRKPSPKELRARWSVDTETLLWDVTTRVDDGRGAVAKLTPALLRNLEQLKRQKAYKVNQPWERYGVKKTR